MGVRLRVSRTGLISAAGSMALPLFAAIGYAQTPATPLPVAALPRPVTGFVSSYAILRTAHAAGFEPLAPPLRDGTIYVLRATDFRGILMRVVLDARTGAIRDVTRIVPADADEYETPYGEPPYASPPYVPSPYEPPSYDPPAYEAYGAPDEYDAPAPEMAPPSGGLPAAPTMRRPAASVHLSSPPPLPRPRPAELVTQKSATTTGSLRAPGGVAQSADVQARGGASPAAANAGASATPATAPSKTPPPAPLND
jgi:hypothetical protein